MLEFIQNTREVPFITKFKLCNTILLNSLLQGSKNQSINRTNIAKYKAFYCKVTQRILGILMLRVKDKKIKNKMRKRFINSKLLKSVQRQRQLLLLGRITQLDSNKHLLTSIAAACSKCCHRMQFHTIQGMLVENICTIAPDVDSRSSTQEQIGHTKERLTQEHMVNKQKLESIATLVIYRISKILSIKISMQNNQHSLNQVSITKIIILVQLLNKTQVLQARGSTLELSAIN